VLRGGIDLGGTKIQAVVVDGKWNVVGSSRRPTPTSGGPEDVAEQMSEALKDAAAEAGTESGGLRGAGVGSPGDVDTEAGTVSQARNLPGWAGRFELGPWLSDALGTAVSVGNDVGVATEAELKLGAGRPYDSLIGVFWGTGVGGGIILNGEHWLGRGAAGEIGHMVVKTGGARCTCGRRGCMEAYAGRAAMEIKARKKHEGGAKTDLFKIMEKHGRDRLTSGIWAGRSRRRTRSRRSSSTARSRRSAPASPPPSTCSTSRRSSSGGLGVRFGEPYAKRIAKAMKPHLFTDTNPPAMHVAALGDFGGAIGAALLSANHRPDTAAKRAGK
jgi:glucokinase